MRFFSQESCVIGGIGKPEPNEREKKVGKEKGSSIQEEEGGRWSEL